MNISNKHKATAAVVTVLVLFVSSLAILTASAGASLSLSANNVKMSSDDGQIEKVTVGPNGQFHWNNVDTTPNNVLYRVYIKKSGGSWEKIIQEKTPHKHIEDKGTTGHDVYDLNAVEIDDAVPYEQLDDDTDGGNNKTKLKILVRAYLRRNGSVLKSVDKTATFWVVCSNEAESFASGGNANTGGSPTQTR